MQQIVGHDLISGFEVTVHRALTEPILLAGAPRTLAIVSRYRAQRTRPVIYSRLLSPLASFRAVLGMNGGRLPNRSQHSQRSFGRSGLDV